MTDQPNVLAGFDRLRRRRPWLDHVVRAGVRYTERHGNHYAAGITYFSLLALVPLTMVAFAVVTLVLVSEPDPLARLRAHIDEALPATLEATVNSIIDQAVASASTVGVIGILIATYTGLRWMSNLRAALSEQWGQPPQAPPFLRRLSVDLAALLGLGLAAAVSFGITTAAGFFAERILELLGLADFGWARVLLTVLGVVLSLLADWLLFLWIYARLPRERMTWHSARRAAAFAAVGMELIKQGMVVYLAFVTRSPTGAAFGPILGLMVFMYTVSRFLIFIAAWAATARENQVERPPPPPQPAVIRPEVRVRQGLGTAAGAGLVGAAAVAGLIGGRLLTRRGQEER
ncbi:inner membrane protein YhjD [Pseudonocardia halophobica]|uniref:Inner membrane protein YhjD n=1 Tax=Pseudonocardia halophobica TaxID=29401 RepID=A0A9W6NXV2_9PSEU|nr:inner membrane protein YhjD [Pseudonocardia halophobica]GLL13046.1 inner membrane protein YhjD [Pseudonocardia halophobica]